MKPKITIIDYGVGNLQSLKKAFAYFGVNAVISEDAAEITASNAVVLPGVGSFDAGMRGLKLRGLAHTVQQVAAENKPILGICLGAQLLLTKGHEFGEHKGLDIIPGEVVRFDEREVKEKVPQVGWNTVRPPDGTMWQGSVFTAFSRKEMPNMYFTHSYIFVPKQKEDVFGLTTYGGTEFCSVIRKGNIYGCQFHPEKSGEAGLALIKNFVSLVSDSFSGRGV